MQKHSCLDKSRQVKHIDITSPSHYTNGAVEPWDYITYIDMSFIEGNIIKYITRYKYKDGIADLKKALKYTQKLILSEKERLGSAGNQKKKCRLRAGIDAMLIEDAMEKYITSHNMNFCEGKVIEYITRYVYKGDIVRLYRICHHIQKLIDVENAKIAEDMKLSLGMKQKHEAKLREEIKNILERDLLESLN